MVAQAASLSALARALAPRAIVQRQVVYRRLLTPVMQARHVPQVQRRQQGRRALLVATALWALAQQLRAPQATIVAWGRRHALCAQRACVSQPLALIRSQIRILVQLRTFVPPCRPLSRKMYAPQATTASLAKRLGLRMHALRDPFQQEVHQQVLVRHAPLDSIV